MTAAAPDNGSARIPLASAGITVGVVGTGNMGSALVKGWLRSPEPRIKLIVWDKIEASARRLLGFGDSVEVAASLTDLVTKADIILVVVKPKDSGEVLGAIGSLIGKDQVVVSSMAGVTTESMRTVLGPRRGLFRIMPNLGVELGVGAVALAAEPGVSEAEVEVVARLLEPLGLVEIVSEELLDVVTAVSGSGPAFLALAVEGLEDGAVAAGLGRMVARTLVRQMVLTTARLLAVCSDSPADLRALLALTGNLDQENMDVLENRGIRSAFRHAVEAALERSREMRAAEIRGRPPTDTQYCGDIGAS